MGVFDGIGKAAPKYELRQREGIEESVYPLVEFYFVKGDNGELSVYCYKPNWGRQRLATFYPNGTAARVKSGYQNEPMEWVADGD